MSVNRVFLKNVSNLLFNDGRTGLVIPPGELREVVDDVKVIQSAEAVADGVIRDAKWEGRLEIVVFTPEEYAAEVVKVESEKKAADRAKAFRLSETTAERDTRLKKEVELKPALSVLTTPALETIIK